MPPTSSKPSLSPSPSSTPTESSQANAPPSSPGASKPQTTLSGPSSDASTGPKHTSISSKSCTVKVESSVVDVPEGNTEADTHLFADTVVRLTLQKLASVADGTARDMNSSQSTHHHQLSRRLNPSPPIVSSASFHASAALPSRSAFHHSHEQADLLPWVGWTLQPYKLCPRTNCRCYFI
ncbi:unnamed protein product [Camellia sinensis]